MKKLFFVAILAPLLIGCSAPKDDTPTWARGADLSWLSEMEHDSVMFYNDADCIEMLQEAGMNAVRLRVWVNHSTGWSNIPDMVSLAQRVAQARLRLMIDIHYSDFFADPQHQTIPEAWQDYSYDRMREAVQAHTTEVLRALQDAGIEPQWVQIGNETPNGMLWPMAKVNSQMTDSANLAAWDRYAGLTAAGYEAAKAVFPDITVIVHVDNAYMYRDWFWYAMKEHGGKWDMIGLSHYPMMTAWTGKPWQEVNDLAIENIRLLIRTFRTPVMVAEIGMMNYGEGAVYDSVAALSEQVMNDFVSRAVAIDSCEGIFYWEPEVFGGWRPAEYIPLGWGGYDMGSFTPDGAPSPALQTLLNSRR